MDYHFYDAHINSIRSEGVTYIGILIRRDSGYLFLVILHWDAGSPIHSKRIYLILLCITFLHREVPSHCSAGPRNTDPDLMFSVTSLGRLGWCRIDASFTVCRRSATMNDLETEKAPKKMCINQQGFQQASQRRIMI